MSFIDKFTEQKEAFSISVVRDTQDTINENYLGAQKVLRGLGYKIKLETRTKFGVQIDLAKRYPENQLKKDLKGFDFEIQDDVVFVKP